jgi:hypothetical protein
MFWTALAAAQEKDAFTADRHKERNVLCDACHGDAQPKTPASAGACLTCHKSMEAVAERTKNFDRNPHRNHLTESSDIECTQCHQGHKADVVACNQCHPGLQFERIQTETK